MTRVPGVSVASDMKVDVSVSLKPGELVGEDNDAAGTLTFIFGIDGLAISTCAQKISCVGAGGLIRLEMEAKAGVVKANNAARATNKETTPTSKVGKSQVRFFAFLLRGVES